MDFLNSLYMLDILHMVSTALLIPTVVVLLIFILFSIYSIGSIIIEATSERRYYRASIPELVARINEATFLDLGKIIGKSGLLRRQRDDIYELITYMYLPEDARTEVARRLLSNENLYNQKQLGYTDAVAKIAPLLGLMGTLIPLGPGIIALSTGDTETLSSALLVAFDTTIAGLAAAVVCFIISRIRRRWYSDYIISMESVYNTLLEKAQILHDEGYIFPKSVYSYDKNGKRARRKNVSSSSAVSEVIVNQAVKSIKENDTKEGNSNV